MYISSLPAAPFLSVLPHIKFIFHQPLVAASHPSFFKIHFRHSPANSSEIIWLETRGKCQVACNGDSVRPGSL